MNTIKILLLLITLCIADDLAAQTYVILRTGPEQTCGNNSGRLTMMSTGNVIRWEIGSFNGTFTVESTINTSSITYEYNLIAPAQKAYRAYCAGPSGFGYSNVITVRASEAVNVGMISTSSPLEYQGVSGSGTFSAAGLVGTEVWLQREWGTSDWVPSVNGAGFQNLQTTTSYKARAMNSDYSCTDESDNTITIKVYKPGKLAGLVMVTEGEHAFFSLTGNYLHVERWEYSEDGGSTWIHIPNRSTTYTHLMNHTIRVRVLVNQGPTFAPTYSNAVETVMTQYSPDAGRIQDMNYVREHSVLVHGITTAAAVDGLTAGQKVQVTTYEDGFGRPVQQNALAASPDQKDVVVPVSYDQPGGNTVIQYNPYVSAQATGGYSANAVAEQLAFYANGSTDKVQDDTHPFSATKFESSPLRWLLEQGSPGAAFQPGGGHTIRDALGTNVADEVRMLRADGSSAGFYAANELRKVRETDQDGKMKEVFSDKSGKTILSRVQLDEVVQGATQPWLETYYVYTYAGRLRYLVPPKGVLALRGGGWTWTAAFQEQYVHQFVYDILGRIVEKKVPGKGSVYSCYDRLDRLVLEQDANMRAKNQWLFTKYDRRGRPVMTGIYTNTTHTTRAAVQQNLVDGLYANEADPYYEERGTVLHGYTNRCFPSTGAEVLTVQYYDSYDFTTPGTADYAYVAQGLTNEGTQATASALPTANKRKVLGKTDWLYQYTFYDAEGQIIQVRNNNHRNLAVDNVVTYVYDFVGRVTLLKSDHRAGPGKSATVTQRQVFDHAGRLRRVYQRNNTDAEVLLLYLVYNGLGQLVDKKLHCTSCPVESVGGAELSSALFLQSVDYRYDSRGLLASINNAQLTADVTTNDEENDYFGMEFLRHTVQAGLSNSAQYNGNISAMKWKGPGGVAGANDQESYAFSYDKANRLTVARSQKSDAGAWTKEVNLWNEQITYDVNGNIMTLKRNHGQLQFGVTPSGAPTSSHVSAVMDDLSYTYASTMPDRLVKVDDTGDAVAGFKNGVTTAEEFVYDGNGNVVTDKNKTISNIVYNVLGKPGEIVFNDGRKVLYTFDAAGRKLAMATYKPNTTVAATTLDYVDGFVYKNDTLAFFGSPGGRVVNKGGSLEYQYALMDHQGNTRVVFTSAVATAQVLKADFEAATNGAFQNYPAGANRSQVAWYNHSTAAGTTSSQVLTGAANSQVGVAKSFKVFPGDKISIEAYAKYFGTSGTNNNVSAFATALTAAFGLTSSAVGEAAQAYEALQDYGAFAAAGGNPEQSPYPEAYVNILLFDKDFNFLDIAYDRIDGGEQPAGSTVKTPHDYMNREYTVREAGYAYVFVSNENATQVQVYFDDITVQYTPTNIVQYNEYYPYGQQTAASWTRDDSRNPYLYNHASELNDVTGWYETAFRDYDPLLGRFMQVDPLAAKYASVSGWHYAYGNPILFNDPNGAEIWPGPPPGWFEQMLANAMQSEYGGGWSSTGGSYYFTSSQQAYQAGVNYNNAHNSWAYTNYGSEAASREVYGNMTRTGNGHVPSASHYKYNIKFKSRNGNNVSFKYLGAQQGVPQTWYYMSRDGMPHGMVYDPIGKYIYEINEVPRGMGVLEQLEILILNSFPSNNVKAKVSVAYQYKQGSPEWSSLLEREKGNTYLLSPVTVTNPAAATAWFQGQTGNAWNYSLGANNCAHYAVQGLNAGGAGINFPGALPSSFPIAPTMTWTAGQLSSIGKK